MNKNDINNIREYLDVVDNRIKLLKLLDNISNDLKLVNEYIGALMKNEESKINGKLIKIGVSLFFLPLPLISEILGGTLIATGYILSKIKKRTSLLHIIKDFDLTIHELVYLKDKVVK